MDNPTVAGRRLQGGTFFMVIVSLILTLFLEALDQTIVGTALPHIILTLQGFDQYTWVVTAYLLASTTMIPIVGKLSDQFGRKWFLLSGTFLFLVGSLLSGLSQNMGQLIAFRALQGLGAGIGMALVVTVVGDIFPPAERAKWQGLFGGVYGISNLIGPTIGGWLTEHGPLLGSLVTETTRWRWVFYINLPIGLLALAALFFCLPTNISVRSNLLTGRAALKKIDFLGAALICAATTSLLLGLTWGSEQTSAWGSPLVIAMLLAAMLLFILFVLVERSATEPILPLGLFRSQIFSADALLSLLQGMILLGIAIYLPLFLQGVLGVSATNAGLWMTPFSLSLPIGAMVAGALVARFKRYQMITVLSMLLMLVGLFLLTRITPDSSLLEVAFVVSLACIGLGTLFSILTLVAQNLLPPNQLGVGTATIRYVGQLGPTLGVALVGTVVNLSLSSELASRIPGSAASQLTPAGLKLATDPQVLVDPAHRTQVERIIAGFGHLQDPNLLNQIFSSLKVALAAAIQHGFTVVLILGILAFLASFFLKDIPLAERAPLAPEAIEASTDKQAILP